METGALLRLRSRLEALGGSLVLERSAAGPMDGFPAYGSRGKEGALGRDLRVRFDPGGILSPGRFGT
ncbi:MAG: hypothetical protein FIA95_01620 [Gemmatimonadetes bacterium]|nr:hypothetical protein [Gemmatimonadota bacterium]